jgi:predicted XRE-type DNA-binding protein
MAKKTDSVVASSGNVFADLGLPGAEEKQTKVQLAVALNQIIKKRRLSQSAAADALGVNQPKISALTNYRLDGFSVERLMNFLNALGHDIEIIIRKQSSRRSPGIHVTAA